MFQSKLTGEHVGPVPVGSFRIEDRQLMVACADEWLNVQALQMSGKKRMSATDFLNGMRDIAYYHCID